MKVSDLVRAMEAIAPTRFAEDWDNVGLLVGDPGREVTRVLLAIDCTREVAAEARAGKCDAIVSYHPPIFEAAKRLVAGSIAFDAARDGIAIYSPHTALDVAPGGTNDVLADAIEMESARAPLRPVQPRDAEYKLVTFVPADQVERVSRAIFEAGAGRIGKYSSCSFRAPGTGTFFGEQGANPAVGQAGRLEEAAEVRVETVVPIDRAAEVVRAMRAAHPYEEPAFDLVRLAAAPSGAGIGRVGSVEKTTVRAIVGRVKRALGVEHVLCAGPIDREVTRAAVCAGAAGGLAADAIVSKADLLLCGELRHHDALRLSAAGTAVVCTLHSVSERAALAALERRLGEALPGVAVSRSREDRDPYVFA